MKKLVFICLFLLAIVGAKANDAVFYATGNQLVPINETEISVKKEILDITRENKEIHVHVYYEFFNPGNEKTLLVGFEAMPPGGVWETTEEEYKKYTDHPYIHDFTVTINGQRLNYQVAHVVSEGNYFQNGKIDALSRQQELQMRREREYFDGIPYLFVYHFNATFKKGLNIVEHTYTFKESQYSITEYSFEYVLTAANRWANNQIDDFTLNINMGDRESFSIRPTFFNSVNEWTINGVGRVSPAGKGLSDWPTFHLQQGGITFHKANFHPDGEIEINKMFAPIMMMWGEKTNEDVRESIKLQYSKWATFMFEDGCSLTKEEKLILRNIPFAYRGYVFKSPNLKEFFESTEWYVPNPNYVDKIEELPWEEREWVEFWSK